MVPRREVNMVEFTLLDSVLMACVLVWMLSIILGAP